MLQEQTRVLQTAYSGRAYIIISKIAYLIGVPKHIFENEHEPPDWDIFTQMETNKSARIIRHLSILRTAIERNFIYINQQMKVEYKSILSLPQFVPADSINQLLADGINFMKKSNTRLSGHVV